MPNKQNAKYIEWKTWFERLVEILNDDVVLIGHSRGGAFLAKYLQENILPVKISKLILLAAVWDKEGEEVESGKSFIIKNDDFSKLLSQVDDVTIIHSTNDDVVPYKDALRYQNALPGSKLVTLEGGHFYDLEEFPELIEEIKRG